MAVRRKISLSQSCTSELLSISLSQSKRFAKSSIMNTQGKRSWNKERKIVEEETWPHHTLFSTLDLSPPFEHKIKSKLNNSRPKQSCRIKRQERSIPKFLIKCRSYRHYWTKFLQKFDFGKESKKKSFSSTLNPAPQWWFSATNEDEKCRISFWWFSFDYIHGISFPQLSTTLREWITHKFFNPTTRKNIF